jgi:hypothetical protein
MRKNNRKLKEKNLKLTELRNCEKYFDFAGNWKTNKKKNRLSKKQKEDQLRNILKLEYNLNNNITFEPISDIIKLSSMCYRRYELFDSNRLIYSRKSKPE